MSRLSEAYRRNRGRLHPPTNPLESLEDKVEKACNEGAEKIASTYLSNRPSGDYDDCVVLATAGAIAAGTAISNGAGAAYAATLGPPAARMVCRRIFPEQ